MPGLEQNADAELLYTRFYNLQLTPLLMLLMYKTYNLYRFLKIYC